MGMESSGLSVADALALQDKEKVDDYIFVSSLVSDVSKELKCIDRLMIKLKGVDYDMSYISELQDELHEKYKKKMKNIGIDIC